MIRIVACWRRISSALAKIHIVDKFLIVFMVVLMFQSAHNLFASHVATGEAAHIDVIVRTSTAAIFGYFLSANFMRRASYGLNGGAGGSLESRAKSIPTVSSSGVQNRIGFAASGSDNSTDTLDMGSASYSERQNSNESGVNRLQIIITSILGLFCLVVLIIARDISALSADMSASASATATIAQFRDFVSGCIGFLIGCPTTNTSQSK